MAALEQPLALPVSTTFEIANRTISEHIGPAFGIIAWSAGTAARLIDVVTAAFPDAVATSQLLGPA